MFPPIFQLVSASPSVTALIGSSPVRFYPFGEAPQTVAKPYAVWQIIAGTPENYVSQRPDIDSYTTQIDCYAETATAARNVAKAIRDAVEDDAHVTSWRGEMRDEPTGLYRVGFDVSWHHPR